MVEKIRKADKEVLNFLPNLSKKIRDRKRNQPIVWMFLDNKAKREKYLLASLRWNALDVVLKLENFIFVKKTWENFE